ncbi:sorbosone dehydrogenase family protein [Novosphingobium sp. 9U]|uniref:PQQ-dependent sugar dehydrogenase n=1 Tax=Novosphingobium sp. 9U TaxID=2653158 RepID=UPI0012F043B9|nr:PQQ-dependent sugar dehydrogenase [Novosphingobium sp. 9U]VWX53744.1 L-sorbosone dehydrogenase [Novosphingobium sp. 9U]
MKSWQRTALIVLVVIVLLVAALFAYLNFAHRSDRDPAATTGVDPVLVEPAAQTLPSVSLAKPSGWGDDLAPQAVQGLVVSRFASGLDHPRTLLTLPNGDVLAALTNAPASGRQGGITGFFMKLFMGRVGAADPSPDTIVLLRDAAGDGKAETRSVFRQADMHSPSGMAYGNGKLYIANHNAVLEFAFTPGETKLVGKPKQLMELPGGGNHWMRNLLLSPDGAHLYAAVGSATNIADNGMEAETGRAAIWEIDTATGRRRQYAAGMRNPNGMDWNPSTAEMWAVVQERDMLGPDLVPDYLTNVPVGAQYGWPWVYWKDKFDERVTWPMDTYMLEYTRKPEYAMGAHTAVLGLKFAGAGNRLGDKFENGAFVARHGSWNRKPPSGYDVVFVPFDANGNPRGKPLEVLTGFLEKGGDKAHGRPVWLAFDKAGGLLVSDDTGGVIWRVIAPGAAPSAGPRAVVTKHMEPSKELVDPTQPRGSQANFKAGPDRLLP